jgi:hypothetical protein
MKEDRATEPKVRIGNALLTLLWSGPATRGHDHFRPYWQPVVDAPRVAAMLPAGDVRFSNGPKGSSKPEPYPTSSLKGEQICRLRPGICSPIRRKRHHFIYVAAPQKVADKLPPFIP